ncbi:MAG: GAF domain-containing protein [Syntrophaceae bacterium]|nr:GAF domain-containing protein [Syntrophaceae bacterium]
MIVIGLLLLVTFFINIGLGFLVFFKTSVFRLVNFLFSLLAWASAGWILSILLAYSFEDPSWKLFWGRMSFATATIIPAAFLCFSLLFPGDRGTLSSTKLLLLVLPSLFVFGLSFTSQIVSSLGSGPRMFIYGPFYRFFSVYFLTYMLLCFVFLIRSYRKAVGLVRLQIKYFLVGMSLTAGFGVTTNLFLPMAGISKFNWLGPPFTVIMVGCTTYSIVKHRLMDINIVFKKGTTYVLLMLLLFVPSVFLIILGQKVFYKQVNYLFLIYLFFILFLVAVFYYKIRPKTERAVEQLFFRRHYDYRQTLSKFSRAMVSILDLKSLSKRVIETIIQTMGVEKASLFLLNEEKGGYELYESKNINTPAVSLLPKGDPLPHYLEKFGEITIREELVKGAHIPELEGVVNQMSLLGAEMSIPLVSKGQLIGIINLSYKFNRDIYSHEDVELLSTLANQMAIAVENARLYEDLKRSKSYMRRADRLASLGTLTAGLAHEIRNPLVAIKTFTQLLPERLEDEEFLNKFLGIASGEVDRIALLINELLEFAKPSEPKLELENINTILDGMILLVSTEAKKKEIDLIKSYALDLPPVQIDREQIKQVFLNILINAIEATPEHGSITVKTRSFVKPGGTPYVQIEVTDTGCGIPKERLEEIFNFFTTKSGGSGLGLSICHQIVEDHKGYIHVESEVNRGSSFFVNLPLNQETPKRRKDDLGYQHGTSP